VALGRHSDSPTSTPGPRGLEEVGAWGATYWELASYLKGRGARCVNLEGDQARVLAHDDSRSWKRRLFEQVVYAVGVKLLDAPLTAFAPGLNHLVFRKER
jgi:hypothetical protein